MSEDASTPVTIPSQGRVVMISGATGGIGRAVTRRLHADGFTLSLGVRDRDRAEHLFSDFDGGRLIIAHFDAGEPGSAAAWIEATVSRFARIDALINNAGILRSISLTEGDEGILDELWTVNVKAPFRLTRLALPHLKKAGNGRVINIGSTDGKRYRESVSVGYTMSKHAVVALSHATRFAGWDDGVRVTALCPGAVDTEMIASIPGATPPAQRLRPETVAEVVALLLRLPNNASVAELVVNTRLESAL